MTSRTWMITGAGRGLGRALALAAAHGGDRVVATVREPGAAPSHELIAERLLDVRDRAAAFETVAQVVEEFGGIDVLVNNAGYGLVGAIEEIDEDSARDIVETNVLGALWLTQAALPTMRARASGHVVQISSTGGVGTMPTMGLYSASKWALEAFSEALAAEAAAAGVRVSIVEPGSIDTAWGTTSMRFAAPMTAYDALRGQLFGTAEVPWQVSGTGGGTSPDEIAQVVLRHVDDPDDHRLRVLAGEDAPEQIAQVLSARIADYDNDERFTAALTQIRSR